MPKRTDISSILVVGAGPIVIGQACEFDYSGTQAVKALKEEGYRVILVNSNPATIMTDPNLADATYLEPLTTQFLRSVIQKEQPDAVLPTMGGQTALNLCLQLHRDGTLNQYNVTMIGADADAIERAENRSLFQKTMHEIGLETPKSKIARSINDAQNALKITQLPAVIRPSYTLGGEGGGVAYNLEEFLLIAQRGLDASPTNEILVEESVLGWKEFEMEVVRDKLDNAIIVCSIENIDPMGVHTGDSVTVAPAMTLSDKEFQSMRNASLNVLRAVGVETGGSNVQFAVNPKNGRSLVIEMNPRVSRSSALASKATGFPIAKIAAKLAVGYTLDELQNDVTGVTPASFEPAIDYVVVKIPCFAFDKFPAPEPLLTTSMQSVGEAMAVGSSFPEALQKALRSSETSVDSLQSPNNAPSNHADILAQISKPLPNRLQLIAHALRNDLPINDIHNASSYDPWFIEQIQRIVLAERRVTKHGIPNDPHNLRSLKALGFSDKRLAQLAQVSEESVRMSRSSFNIHPAFRRVDTCAAEFAAKTAYMYSTYSSIHCEALPSNLRKAVVLGSGPNRIGQGVEFDYCCCQAAFAMRDLNIESVMINCNPETVSTDYDTSDRLYFEPLTAEDVLEVLRVETSNGNLLGVIAQFGGQTPLKIARDIEKHNHIVMGGGSKPIDLAEDRNQFRSLLQSVNLQQPPGEIVQNPDHALDAAQRVGYPVLARPSYVLGGRGMKIAHNPEELSQFIQSLKEVADDKPVLIDKFLHNAVEIDVDALVSPNKCYVVAVMEHVEEAGVHSGDSACSLPPATLQDNVTKRIHAAAQQLAGALGGVGLLNIQFALQNNELFVIEANPRASRTVPFAAKATGIPIARLAARIMAGDLNAFPKAAAPNSGFVAVKEAVFPFNRFPYADAILSPEMRSTGEAIGLDVSFAAAFAKAQIAAGAGLPTEGAAFISVRDEDKDRFVAVAQDLAALGFSLLATGGTAKALQRHGLSVELVNKVHEQRRPNSADLLKSNRIQLMFNTAGDAKDVADSRTLRRAAVAAGVSYYTTYAGARAAADAVRALQSPLAVHSLQEIHHRCDKQ